MIVSTTDAPVDREVDLLLLPVPAAPSDPFLEALSERLGPAVERAMQDVEGDTGDARVLYAEHTLAPRVAFVGLVAVSDLDAEALRTAAAAGGDVALNREAERVACLLPAEDQLPDARTAQGLVEGFVLGTYRYRPYKTADGFEGPSAFLVHVGDDHDRAPEEEGANRGRHLADEACTAPDLVNRSPDDKPPRQFADAIAASGKEHGYPVETWDEDRICEEGMGGRLAVNRGSFDPPTFSVANWAPDDALTDAPVVLVGKGVIFDTGGLSVKERNAGAITAGKFLDHFVRDDPWLHVDIAGPTFRKTVQAYQHTGGTGFGVRLPVEYLDNYVVAREPG